MHPVLMMRDILELVQELASKYKVTHSVVNPLFEDIRQLILGYDDLIDRVQ